MLKQIYDKLLDELLHDINGDITYDGQVIKWEYDYIFNEGLTYETEDEHLHRIYLDDFTLIVELVDEIDVDMETNISEYEIHDNKILFYI